MKNVIIFVLFITTVTLFGQEYLVDYVDGIVDVQDGRSWLEVLPGDSIPSNATLRLDQGAILELSAPQSRITLSQAGTYEISNFTKNKAADNNVGSMISQKLKTMVVNNRVNKSAVMGVRASDAAEETSLEWMSSESDELLKTGKQKLENANIPGALDDFEMALEFAQEYAEDTNIDSARFYIAYTDTILGKTGPALKQLSEINPDPQKVFYNELVILKGNLLLNSFAYENAVVWLEAFEQQNASSDVRQTVKLLTGLAYKGKGDFRKAQLLLKDAYDIDPESESGELAMEQLSDI